MEEKKFSLDDLPEKEVASETRPKTPPKKVLDPRIEKLKKMDDEQRVGRMVQRWHFDRPERKLGWVLVVVVLFGIEQMRIYERFLAEELPKLNEATMGMGKAFLGLIHMGQFFLLHPFVLVIFIPLIFKFTERSDSFFDLTFDGIETLKEIFPPKGEPRFRTRLKWSEISEVKKVNLNKQDVLQLYSLEGKLAELNWAIDDNKKMALRQLSKGMLHPKHPFRLFMEKEIK